MSRFRGGRRHGEPEFAPGDLGTLWLATVAGDCPQHHERRQVAGLVFRGLAAGTVPALVSYMAIDRLLHAGFENPFGEPAYAEHSLIRVQVCPTQRTAAFIGAEPFVERAIADCRVDDFLIQLWWRDELVHLPPSRFVLRRGLQRLPEHAALCQGDVVVFDLGGDPTPRLQ